MEWCLTINLGPTQQLDNLLDGRINYYQGERPCCRADGRAATGAV